MVKGKPREDILELSHTQDGYDEAIQILSDIHGKGI